MSEGSAARRPPQNTYGRAQQLTNSARGRVLLGPFKAPKWEVVMKTSGWHPRLISQRRPRSGGDEQGQALYEFAIAGVLLFTILFGIIEFSRFLYTYHFLSEVSREATRYAAVRGSTFTSECTAYAPGPGFFDCYVQAGDVKSYVIKQTPSGISSAWTTSTTCPPSSVTSPTVSTCWPGATPDGTTTACTKTTNAPGCNVEVVVSYPYNFMIPFLPTGLSTWTISSTSEQVIQQ